nr:Chain a, PYCO1 LSU binding motif [Phaeodactylum tricornutum]7YK5_b Chain b, PYCO1 LSU binding motif [Phaeodactylum tricornutum]7YK5_c Chain c, PYCO1 LSU binding motif [Phaeodactylum tricornutum]7YK5_d Chain d, PYCO1 LSU binding motif [Phaeodactylum tricornutum]7YK5_e Chain e, PYCO1 LSU binding motif [Phaeodactylum tricornutum]7YK5_f Chain f, PYCO1 LSU binding motif [Phaeodactylum tricornutum]7YK5_g Chain g, PYCO1 LSU binding motif [Phaeodactylum tricornutum]7YK5_h Chain h, PYCO1 LSU bindi
AAEWGSMNQ